jgi:hypothetical protein
MKRIDLENIKMFERVVNFGTTHPDLFPPGTLAAGTFQALGSAITRISTEAADQISGKNGRRRKSAIRSAARMALREQIQRISDTAAAIALDVPGFGDSFRVPEQRSDTVVIHAAKSFANEAQSVKDQFLQHHLPPDFIENLRATTAKLEDAIVEQASTNIKGISAGRSIDETINDCHKLVQRLDAVVTNILGDNALLKTEWEQTRRVGHPATRPAVAAPQQPSGTSAVS